MAQNKALIAMSGGVDSSVAACLMQRAGYQCIGAMMLLHDPAGNAEDAQAVADRLGMPFYLLDRCAAFRQQVMDHFVSAYEQGLTPNPCVQCNHHGHDHNCGGSCGQ